MNNINGIIREMIKEFRSKLSDKEIEEYFSELERVYSDYISKIGAEPRVIRFYQVNDKGKNYPLSYHEYDFVRSLEVVLKDQSQLSLEKVINSMERIINFNLSNDHATFGTILESRPDVAIDDAVDFMSKIVRDTEDNLPTKLHSFLGNRIFKIILQLHPESSLEEVWKQFSEVVRYYYLNVSSQENYRALVEICELCREGNIEKMEKFDFSGFDLDQDSAGVLEELLQHCMNISNQNDYEINNVWVQ